MNAICRSAFGGRVKLEEVVIPDTVVEIGERAFENCINLKRLVLSKNISEIPEMAFAFCSSLESVEIPDEVGHIGNRAFYECESLKSVTFGVGIREIGSWAFGECKALEEIRLPESLKIIGSSAFSGCKRLRRAYICDSTKRIGDFSFDLAPELTVVASRWSYAVSYAKDCGIKTEFAGERREDVGFMHGTTLCECVINESKVVIPEGVSKIATAAFDKCDKIEELVLPETLEEIEMRAFRGMKLLKRVNIPKKVTSITAEAFLNCYSLEEINLHDSVHIIESFAFANCKSLKSIRIPASVVILVASAFMGCESVETITVDEENEFFHSDNNCLILTDKKELLLSCKNGVIPTDGSVTCIRGLAFNSLAGLTDVYIPAAIDFIEPNPFINCPNIESFTVDENNHQYYATGNCIIQRNTGTLVCGCKNSVIPNDGSVTNIADFAFMGCTELEKMYIPNKVRRIGDCAFFGCEKLVAVFVPETVKELGESVFRTLGLKDVDVYTDDCSETEKYANKYGLRVRHVDRGFFE